MKKKRLNQILAVERDAKSRAYKDLTKDHHLLQKPDLVSGFSKTYQPRNEEGERFPDESRVVQLRVSDALDEVRDRQREIWDLTLTKDAGNRSSDAMADIVVDGQTLIRDVPVPTLLFLEKQLDDLRVFISKLPSLPSDEVWQFDAGQGYYVSAPIVTTKTAKVQKPLVLYPATDKHPAQTQLVTEDVTIGTWTTVKHNGALPSDRKKELTRRVEKLIDAVKDARERANMAEVEDRHMADALFSYILG